MIGKVAFFWYLPLWGLLHLSGAIPATVETSDSKSYVDQVQHQYDLATTKLLINSHSSNCNNQNIAVRKSWDDLSDLERADYIQAVKCLNSMPPLDPINAVPGVNSRRGDFTYIHMNQTNFIHNSAYLLPWHRQFIWSYEKALREECGYKGYQPYWDYAKHSENQPKSPVFAGNSTGFGGNGEFVPHPAYNASLVGLGQPFYITGPAGSGGGCITDGAFANLTIHLGPVTLPGGLPNDTYGYLDNPRCLKRDFNDAISTNNLTYDAMATLLKSNDMHAFRPLLEKTLHSRSHSYIGGEMFDVYTSPNDPVFYLLHAQVDRLWTLWQGQDYETRWPQVDGTLTWLNMPPSPNGTLDTVMHMGLAAGGEIRIRDAISATNGSYCYRYAAAA